MAAKAGEELQGAQTDLFRPICSRPGALGKGKLGEGALIDVDPRFPGTAGIDLRQMGVEVAYLCTANGTTQDGWMKKVTELDLPAMHIYLNPALSREIMTFFDLPGYPSHVFLDKNGRYVPNLLHRISELDFEVIREKL